MPTTYTHDIFGKEVYKKLPKEIKAEIKTAKSLYLTGLHGPDILFYYKPLGKNTVNKTALDVHNELAAVFFENAIQRYHENPSKELASYILGFGCHYILDSVCHPYVWDYVEKSGISHAEIETEMDRYYMIREGKDPFTYLPAVSICQTRKGNEVISSVFNGITPGEIKQSLTGMKFYVGLLVCKSKYKRRLLLTLLKIVGCYDSMEGQIFRETIKDGCKESTKMLASLYNQALEEAVPALINLYECLHDEQILSERFNRDFE